MSTESISFTPPFSITAARPVVPVAYRAEREPAVVRNSQSTDSDADQALSQAVEELNRYVAGSRTDLRFAVDHDAGKVIVSIVDSESGQVLRQMPSVEALRIAHYLEHDRLGLIRQRA